jgi:hypothetical protein
LSTQIVVVVFVGLQDVAYARTVVAGVSETVTIVIELARVDDVRTVVLAVRDAVGVGVGLSRRRQAGRE